MLHFTLADPRCQSQNQLNLFDQASRAYDLARAARDDDALIVAFEALLLAAAGPGVAIEFGTGVKL